MKQAAAGAAEAMDALAADLEVLAGRANGSPRLGPERYAELFHLVDGTDEPVDQVLARAERRSRRTRGDRRLRAGGLERDLPRRGAAGRRRGARGAPVRARLPGPGRLGGGVRRRLPNPGRPAFAFTREHDVITLPDPRTLWVGPSPSS